MPSADPAKWIWHQPQPPDWKPQVTVNGSKVTVTFFSYALTAGDDPPSTRTRFGRGLIASSPDARTSPRGQGVRVVATN